MTSQERPQLRASSSPIIPAPTKRRVDPLMAFNSERKDFALTGAKALAPSNMAFSRTALPSVPLRPTAPPIPAMGLTMNPMDFKGMSPSILGIFPYAPYSCRHLPLCENDTVGKKQMERSCLKASSPRFHPSEYSLVQMYFLLTSSNQGYIFLSFRIDSSTFATGYSYGCNLPLKYSSYACMSK